MTKEGDSNEHARVVSQRDESRDQHGDKSAADNQSPKPEKVDQVNVGGVHEDPVEDRSFDQPVQLNAIVQHTVEQTLNFVAAAPEHNAKALLEYKKVDPNFPDRILKMAEADQAMELREHEADIKNERVQVITEAAAFGLSTLIATLTPWVVLVGGFYLIVHEFNVAGYIGAALGVAWGGVQIVQSTRMSNRSKKKSLTKNSNKNINK